MQNFMVDTGATSHIVNDKRHFTQLNPGFDASRHTIELADGTRKRGVAKEKGSASISLTDLI